MNSLIQTGVRHAHQQNHAKKDVIVDVVWVTDTVYAEPTDLPDIVVYVDQNGVPRSTYTDYDTTPTFWSTAYGVAPTPAASTSPISTPVAVVNTPVVVDTPAPVVSSTAPVVPPVVDVQSSSSAAFLASTPVSSSSAPAETTTFTSGSTGGSGHGLSYSPYNADNSCKTQDQVNTDFEQITGYSLVRIYGTDCNQTATVLTAAKAKKMMVFAGIFDISTLSSEIGLIVEAAENDWSSIDTVAIGNELVNSGTASPTAVVAAIGTARGLLSAAGYNGRVVTVDTLVASRANPSLCDASDYCAVNCHPFFDGTVAAGGSGDFLTNQIPTLQATLANKDQEVVITETGWPWQGLPNGAAVPSTANQVLALKSIKSTFTSNPAGVILFTPYNDMWKANTAGQFEAEQYWGFIGNSPSG